MRLMQEASPGNLPPARVAGLAEGLLDEVGGTGSSIFGGELQVDRGFSACVTSGSRP